MRISFCLMILAAAPAIAKDPCVSGPQTGQRPGPYSFLVSSGPQRGQQTCYICETAEKPGVVVFARSLSDPLAKLAAKCDDALAAREKDGLKSWLTVLGEKTVTQENLAKWAKKTGLKAMPTGVFDDHVGPPSYRLAEDADVTILLFVDRKAIANFAFRAGELDDKAIQSVSDEIGKFGRKK